MPHYVTNRITSTVSFVDELGNAFDPASLRVTYRLPAAARLRRHAARKVYGKNAGIDRVSTGVYSITLLPTQPGNVEVVWESYAEGEELTIEHVIPVVPLPEIVRTFTGPNSDDNRFTGPNSDDNR